MHTHTHTHTQSFVLCSLMNMMLLCLCLGVDPKVDRVTLNCLFVCFFVYFKPPGAAQRIL